MLADKTIVVRSGDVGHCLHIGVGAQAVVLCAAALLALWLGVATTLVVGQGLRTDALWRGASAAGGVSAAYERRIAELEARAASDRSALNAAQERLDRMATELGRRHDAFAEAATQAARAEQAEAALANAEAARKEALRAHGETLAKLSRVERDRADLAETLERVAGALEGAADQRDDATAQAQSLADAMEVMRAAQQAARARQTALLSELERAAKLSIAPLETMLDKSGVDVDAILSSLRQETETLEMDPDGAAGGPFVPDDALDAGAEPSPGLQAAQPGPDDSGPDDSGPDDSAPARPLPRPEGEQGAALDVDARATALVADLEKLQLLRVAAVRMPFATPVRAPRFTSGFGTRTDPINKHRAFHAGLDMAGPVGTPILSPADGVVTFVGRQHGYGRMVKIRHDFGVETVYGHLNRARVRVGERVVRGQRIADMGRSGRATGSHLHYEIHVDGRPVDPMRFIKAARYVL